MPSSPQEKTKDQLLTQYQKALFNAGMGVYEFNIKTCVFTFDESLRQLFGFSEGVYSCTVEEWLSFILPEDKASMSKLVDDAINDSTEVNIQQRIITKEGKLKHIRSCATKIKEDNVLMSYVGVTWDVTKEVEFQQQALKNKIFIEQVLNTIPDPVFVKAENRLLLYANDEFEKLMGVSKENLIGHTDYEYLAPETAELCRKNDDDVFKAEVSIESEELTYDAEGRPRIVLTKKTPMMLPEGERILVGVLRDITDLKKMQSKFIEQSKMASLGEMAASIAHEVNNPLMIIQGKSQILLEKLNTNKVEIKSCRKDMEQIEQNCIRLDKIIKSLKSVSRKSDKDPLEKTCLTSLIDESLSISAERFKKKNIKIIFNKKDNPENCFVSARPSEIVQVMVNLLNNSYDAISGHANSWVQIGLKEENDFYLVDVVDSGSEILPDVVKKMMDPFFTTKPTGKGTGLGLSLSKNIIEYHKGELYFDSSHQQTRFVFTLPKFIEN